MRTLRLVFICKLVSLSHLAFPPVLFRVSSKSSCSWQIVETIGEFIAHVRYSAAENLLNNVRRGKHQ